MDLDPHSSLQGVQGVGVCRGCVTPPRQVGSPRASIGPARQSVQEERESKQLFALIDLIPLGFIGFFPFCCGDSPERTFFIESIITKFLSIVLEHLYNR